MKNQYIETARSALMVVHASDFSEEIFTKAVAKTKRWMVAAYGGVDWDELDDATDTIANYYRETVKKPFGKNTSNRQTLNRV